MTLVSLLLDFAPILALLAGGGTFWWVARRSGAHAARQHELETAFETAARMRIAREQPRLDRSDRADRMKKGQWP